MRLTVEKYMETFDCHFCKDKKGKMHKVDLLVSGLEGETRQSLIGKTIEVNYLHPFIEIAFDVKVIAPTTAKAGKE